MAFFDDLGRKINDVGQSAFQKGKEMTDVVKYNSMLSDEERRLSSIYEAIGRKYVEINMDSEDAQFSDSIEAIRESKAKIEEYKLKIIELKGARPCPNCGASVPNTSQFCQTCGNRMEQAQNAGANTAGFCTKCGATLVPGSRFCTSCGNPVNQ